MVLIQLDLSEEQNTIVREYAVKNSLTDKRQAIARIIEDHRFLMNEYNKRRGKK